MLEPSNININTPDIVVVPLGIRKFKTPRIVSRCILKKRMIDDKRLRKAFQRVLIVENPVGLSPINVISVSPRSS